MSDGPGKLPKTAIVVFVRNEFPDFCSWLSWYATIGANTIIVYDDHSTDGTWEAAVAAARVMDIRPRRTDLSVDPFTARQRDAYLGAIREFRGEFDWMGFVDADEYLYIRNNVSLPALLAKHQNASAVAFSWCIYGSNGHLLKPDATNVEAFTRHSLPSFGHNRSVKSFVRPEHVIDHWRDPHTFEIGGKRYVDPNGVPVHWGGPGAIAHEPDWSVAKLMHYIPRSMEHFIERIRRRSDLQGLTNEYWNVFNMNDVEDRAPLRLLPAFHQTLFQLEMELVKAFVADLISLTATAANGDTPSQSTSVVTASLVETAFGTRLALDGDNGLVHVTPALLHERRYKPVYLVASPVNPGVGHLVAARSKGPIRINHDHRRSEVLPFKIIPGKNPDLIAFKTIKSRRFLAATPPGPEHVGHTAADRWHANDWEHFKAVDTASLGSVLGDDPGLRQLATTQPTIDRVLELGRTISSPSTLGAAIHLLPENQRKEMQEMTRQVLPSWI